MFLYVPVNTHTHTNTHTDSTPFTTLKLCSKLKFVVALVLRIGRKGCHYCLPVENFHSCCMLFTQQTTTNTRTHTRTIFASALLGIPKPRDAGMYSILGGLTKLLEISTPHSAELEVSGEASSQYQTFVN